jgi:ornithine cyclodeaminase
MLFINAEQTREALSFTSLLSALRQAFAQGATIPTRHMHRLSTQAQQGMSLIMPAWNEAGYYGIKIVNIFPDNGKINLPSVHATYTLHSARTGVPLAYIDGDVITLHRTAAVAALGASYLARQEARVLTLVGAGRIARWLAPAMQAVRPIEKVQIWNRRTSSAEELAAYLRQQGIAAQAVTDLQKAVQASDIVSCATLATEPLIQAAWLRPGTHLDLIGSFTPEMIEAHPECFRHAKVYIDTDDALMKAGDLLQAFKAKTLSPDGIRGRLHELVQGTVVGRSDEQEITVFKAVGNALTDLTAAILVYETITGGDNSLGC